MYSETRAALVIVALLASLALEARGEIIDQIAATVNQGIITRSDVDDRLRTMGQQVDEANSARLEQMRKEVLDQMIAEQLINQEAATQEIDISQADVDQAINEIRNQNGMGEEEFVSALKDQGLTMAAYKEKVKEQLVRLRLINSHVRARVSVSEEEIGDFYNKHIGNMSQKEALQVRHIVCLAAKEAKAKMIAEKRAKAERALARIRKGEDFAKVAMEMSEGPSAPQGGVLGYISQGTLDPDFENAAFALKDGEVSELIRTAVGFHIIKVDSRRKSDVKPLAEVRDEIKNRLYQDKMEKGMKAFVDDLRKKAHVKVHL